MKESIWIIFTDKAVTIFKTTITAATYLIIRDWPLSVKYVADDKIGWL